MALAYEVWVDENYSMYLQTDIETDPSFSCVQLSTHCPCNIPFRSPAVPSWVGFRHHHYLVMFQPDFEFGDIMQHFHESLLIKYYIDHERLRSRPPITNNAQFYKEVRFGCPASVMPTVSEEEVGVVHDFLLDEIMDFVLWHIDMTEIRDFTQLYKILRHHNRLIKTLICWLPIITVSVVGALVNYEIYFQVDNMYTAYEVWVDKEYSDFFESQMSRDPSFACVRLHWHCRCGAATTFTHPFSMAYIHDHYLLMIEEDLTIPDPISYLYDSILIHYYIEHERPKPLAPVGNRLQFLLEVMHGPNSVIGPTISDEELLRVRKYLTENRKSFGRFHIESNLIDDFHKLFTILRTHNYRRLGS